MTEDINLEKVKSFHKEKRREEMKHQVISFALMIIFTIIAFIIVAAGVEKVYALPIILLLAVIQVGFQYLYFMHMKDKGHEFVSILIYGGAFIAAVMAITFTTIIWW